MKVEPRPMRWKDGSGVVHAMTMSVVKGREFGRSGKMQCITVCGVHNGCIYFPHPKYSPLPVSCVGCIGFVPAWR